MKLEAGAIVKIVDNGRIVTHITPRWTYGYCGTVVRLNDLSVSVKLAGPYEGETVRVNYPDLIVIKEAVNDH